MLFDIFSFLCNETTAKFNKPPLKSAWKNKPPPPGGAGLNRGFIILR